MVGRTKRVVKRNLFKGQQYSEYGFEGELLTAEETADFLRVSPETLSWWRRTSERTGPIFCRIGGRRIVYRLSDLLAFVRKGMVRPGAPK
jgi:hypothetical protein